jgi:FKBP-type peptidyl-prolyl cis-trans isomerase FklB
MFHTHSIKISATALVAMVGLSAGAAEIQSASDLTDARAKASYGIGVQQARSWERQGADLNWDAYFKGILDGAAGGDLLLSDQEITDAMNSYRTEVQARVKAKLEAEGAKNQEAGEKFLAENKTKEGVVTTASGLQYKVLKMGDGPKPTANDKVKVHYTGTLIDGKEFDSSRNREPITFALNRVIAGWTEGLQLMPKGSQFQFFIPPELAYGSQNKPGIGPNQVLIFDVELLDIEAAKPPQPVTSDIIKVPSREEMERGAKIEVIKAEEAQKLIEAEKAKQKDQ